MALLRRNSPLANQDTPRLLRKQACPYRLSVLQTLNLPGVVMAFAVAILAVDAVAFGAARAAIAAAAIT